MFFYLKLLSQKYLYNCDEKLKALNCTIKIKWQFWN